MRKYNCIKFINLDYHVIKEIIIKASDIVVGTMQTSDSGYMYVVL